MERLLFAINILLLPVLLPAQPALHIIPQPVSVQMKQGYFIIDGSTAIQFNKSNKDLQGLAAFFASYVKNISGYKLPLNAAKRKTIRLSVEKTEGVGNEGYLLNVSPNSILIKANSRAGIFYGMQSLMQTLPAIRTNAVLQVPGKGEIYFTTDGTQPSISSRKFTAPVAIDSTVIFKAVSVVNGKVMSRQPAEQEFVVHKAIGKNVVYARPNSTYYPADGPNTLTNGVKGTDNINQYWHGFSGRNLVATVDLGEQKNVQSISLGCLQKYSDWIFLPKNVRFEISDDGKNFTQVASVDNTVSMNEKSSVVHNFKADFSVRKTRFIRVTAQNNVCPPGHPGEGKPAWIFADELIVE